MPMMMVMEMAKHKSGVALVRDRIMVSMMVMV